MTPDTHEPIPPEEADGVTPELVLVGAGAARDGASDDAARPPLPRRPALPTLHLAAHEILRFAPTDERNPEPD